jgi:hypothetical protein
LGHFSETFAELEGVDRFFEVLAGGLEFLTAFCGALRSRGEPNRNFKRKQEGRIRKFAPRHLLKSFTPLRPPRGAASVRPTRLESEIPPHGRSAVHGVGLIRERSLDTIDG